MKNFLKYPIFRKASLAILGTAVMLSSTSVLGEAARINLKVSVTILPDCTVRAAVVDWVSGSRLPITEQRISRDLGILVTTCEGAAPPPVSLKSIAADGQSRPLRAETHVAMDGMAQPLARALPVRVTRSVVVHLPRSDATELAAPHAPDLLLATVSF